jgi:hypothetical protein
MRITNPILMAMVRSPRTDPSVLRRLNPAARIGLGARNGRPRPGVLGDTIAGSPASLPGTTSGPVTGGILTAESPGHLYAAPTGSRTP